VNQAAFLIFLLGLLLTAAAAVVVRRSVRLHFLAPLFLTAAALAGLTLAGAALLQGRTVALDLSAYFPFSVAFTVDRLSAFFLIVICAVSTPVAIFSASYAQSHYQARGWGWYWALLSLFIFSMVVVVASSTMYAFMFGWELMTLTSAGLIVLEGDEGERRHNVFIYLLMMHAGAAAVLAAFLAFLPHSGEMTFAAMRSTSASLPPDLRTAIFLLAFAGFGVKAGIIPLHLWLPKAHPIAPSPVSALMSGVMLKTAVYGFVRFSFDFLGAPPSWWGYLVLAAGAVSGVLGVLYALGEHDLKRLLAYHSVENIGIIYLGLGTSLIFAGHHAPMWATLALAAALLHTLNHAMFKGLLFLAAGAIQHSTHTLDMEELGGLSRRMPVVSATFLIGCCAIVGLPLFNGFISEWLTFRGFVAGAVLDGRSSELILPLMVGVLGLIGGLAAACFIKAYGISFLGRPRTTRAEQAADAPASMSFAMGLLAAACILIGIFPGIALRPLLTVVGTLIPGTSAPPEIEMICRVLPVVSACVVAVILVTFGVLRFRHVLRSVSTWACGLPALTPRMQYAAASFSKPIRQVFRSVYRPDRKIEVLPADQPYFPQAISYHSVRTTSYERSLYRPAIDLVISAARGLRRLHTGNIQAYLLYIFLMLLSLLVYLRFSQ
jgi:hydrogenase-4 component B